MGAAKGRDFVEEDIEGNGKIAIGMQDCLYMGNLSSCRDWGHAKDYIKAMYLILQQDEPDDYVIATGVTTSIREYILKTFAFAGMEILFSGEKDEEKGSIVNVDRSIFGERVGKEYLEPILERIKNDPVVVRVDRNYYRPTEVDMLIGDSTKARTKLGWIPEYDLNGLIEDMTTSDIHLMKKEAHLKNGGYRTLNYFE